MKKNMKKVPRLKRDGRLEIFLDRESLTVMGNQSGLESLAAMIMFIAGKPDLYHEHLGFSWSEELLSGRLVIGLGRHLLTPPTKERDGFGRDFAIMNTKVIGKRFWKSARRIPPHAKLLMVNTKRKA